MGDGDSHSGMRGGAPARPDGTRKRERFRRLGVVADSWEADAQANAEAAAMASVVAEVDTEPEAEKYRGRRRLIERGSPRARMLVIVGVLVALGATAALPILLVLSASRTGGPGPAGALPTWEDATFEPAIGEDTPSAPESPSTSPSSAPATTGPAAPAFATYQAESAANTLTGSARIAAYEGASGGLVVRNIGIWPGRHEEGTLRFTAVTAPTAGTYAVTIYYALLDKDSTATVVVTLPGAASRVLQLSGGRTCCASRTISVALAQGRNTIVFGNPDGHAPAIDRIVVAPA